MSISEAILKKTILKALSGDFINNSRLDLDAAAKWAREVKTTDSSAPEYPFCYVVVRGDLPIEQQIVQVSHAAYEAGSKFGAENWNGSLVILKVDDLNALQETKTRLEVQGVPHLVWNEGNIGEDTAIGTAPLTQLQRRVMKKYKKWSI